MVGKKDEKKFDITIRNYKNVRKSLIGLYEIIKINFNEEDFYYQASLDNLKALNNNIIAILKHSFTPQEVRIRLRDIEFDERETDIQLL